MIRIAEKLSSDPDPKKVRTAKDEMVKNLSGYKRVSQDLLEKHLQQLFLEEIRGVTAILDNQIIILDPFLIKRSPNGREFRVVGVEKDKSVESQWIDGAEKFCWIVTVKFIDDNQLVKLFLTIKMNS